MSPQPIDLDAIETLAKECLERERSCGPAPETELARHALRLIAEVDRLRAALASPGAQEAVRLIELLRWAVNDGRFSDVEIRLMAMMWDVDDFENHPKVEHLQARSTAPGARPTPELK